MIRDLNVAIQSIALVAPRGGGASDAMCRAVALIYLDEIRRERFRSALAGIAVPDTFRTHELWVRRQVADFQSMVASHIGTLGGAWQASDELDAKWLPTLKAWLQP